MDRPRFSELFSSLSQVCGNVEVDFILCVCLIEFRNLFRSIDGCDHGFLNLLSMYAFSFYRIVFSTWYWAYVGYLVLGFWCKLVIK